MTNKSSNKLSLSWIKFWVNLSGLWVCISCTRIAKIQKGTQIPWIKANNPIHNIFQKCISKRQLTLIFNHSTSDWKTKQNKHMIYKRRQSKPRIAACWLTENRKKRVLNEEQPFMYNACLGVKDNLEDMLRKGHCNSTKTYHLFLPCSMLHGSILPEEKQSEVPLSHSVIGLSEKKTKELLSGCSLP